MVNDGKPGDMSTSTSTKAPSNPTTAQLVTLASISGAIIAERVVGGYAPIATAIAYCLVSERLMEN